MYSCRQSGFRLTPQTIPVLATHTLGASVLKRSSTAMCAHSKSYVVLPIDTKRNACNIGFNALCTSNDIKCKYIQTRILNNVYFARKQ